MKRTRTGRIAGAVTRARSWDWNAIVGNTVIVLIIIGIISMAVWMANTSVDTDPPPVTVPTTSTTWTQTLPSVVYANDWLTIYCDGPTALYKWNGDNGLVVPNSTKCAGK
jgi:hypothetical protein